MLDIGNLLKPARSTIIDSLSDIEPEIKACMVSTSKYKNEFVLFVLSFAYFQFRTLIFQQVRINETGFVSKVFRAFGKMFREMSSGDFFK